MFQEDIKKQGNSTKNTRPNSTHNSFQENEPSRKNTMENRLNDNRSETEESKGGDGEEDDLSDLDDSKV
jgi:hypothetical protein